MHSVILTCQDGRHSGPAPDPLRPFGSNLVFQWTLFFYILWGGTRSLRMLALRPASQTGPMRNPREGTSVVLRDTITLT